tara:strand:- start:115 stop:990 length:876 start_codon:yes stop_codon:yes gene_type:complete
MAIQIRGNQVLNNTIGALQLNEADTYDFTSGTVSVATPSAAAHAATKAYVDAAVPDTFSGGDGIVITDASPDVIAVDLATNPGLQFTSNKLDLKVKAESGGSLTKDANGIYIANAAIGNAKLVSSTISGKALGTSLAAIAAGQGLALAAPYDGSAAQTMDIALDAATLTKGAGGLKVSDLGIAAGQIAGAAVTTAKIADNAVTAAKVSFGSNVDKLTPNGSLTAFDLSATIPSEFASIMVFRNGMSLEQVATPANIDEFKLELAAGTGGVSLVTFGAAIPSGENVRVFFIA